MPTNYLTQFATSGTANLPVESTWQNLTERATGFQTGLARSSYFNRLFAQGANAAYVIGQMVVDYASADADLDGATLYTNFKTALNSYVGGSFLPLSGGTMTGNILASQSDLTIRKTITTGRTIVRGSTDYNTGASLYLIGKDYTGTGAGGFEIATNDGSNARSLRGSPSGEVTWGGKHLAFGPGTFTVTGAEAFGHITGGATSLSLIFPFVVIGSSVSFSSITASVRIGTGGYTSPGGATAESLLPAGVTQTVYIYENSVRLELTKSSGWGATNNSTVVAVVSTMTFTVS